MRSCSHEETRTELFRFCGGLDTREVPVSEDEFENGFVAVFFSCCLNFFFESLGGHADHWNGADFGEVLVLEKDGVGACFLVRRVVAMQKTVWDKLFVAFSCFVKTDEKVG